MTHPTHKHSWAMRVASFLSAFACLAIAFAPAQSPQPAQLHSNPENGIKADIVPLHSGAQKAGLEVGDTLSGWSFQTKSGSFESPFDHLLVEDEYAQRGPVEITGFHKHVATRWSLNDAKWGFTAALQESRAEVAGEMDARTFELKNDFSGAGSSWETLGKSATGTTAAWFYQSAQQDFAHAANWPAVDRVFAASLQAASQNPAACIEINSAWGDSFFKRAQPKDAAERYQAAIACIGKLDLRVTRARLLIATAQMDKRQRHPQDALPLSLEALEIRKILLPQTTALVQAYMLTGSYSYDLQQLDKAEGFLNEAVKVNLTTFHPETYGAGIFHNLALIKMARGQYPEARTYFEDSLKVSGQIDPNGEQFASTNSSLGNLLKLQGDLADAQEHLKLALEIRKRINPQSLATAGALMNLADLDRIKGNFETAQTEYDEALSMTHQLAPGTYEEAVALSTVASFAQSRRDLALAADRYAQSEALWAKLAPQSAQWARVVVNYGQVKQDQGNLKEAERLYNEAIAVPGWQKESPIARAGVARALAELYADQNKVDESIESDKKALAIYTEAAPGSLDLAATAEHLGESEQVKGDWNAAEQYFQQALDIRARLLPDTSDVAESLRGMALVALHAGDRERAISLLSQAIDALEAQSSRLGGSDLVKAGFRAGFSQYYRELADMLLSVNRNEAAFRLTERYRARTLLDQLALRSIPLSGAPQELTSQLRDNADEYDKVQAQILRQSPNLTSAQSEKLRGRLLELTSSRAKTIEDIRRQSPGFAQLRFPPALTTKEVQAALDPGTSLISFLVERQKTYIFLIQPQETQPALSVFSASIGEADLRAKIQDFRSAIQGTGPRAQAQLKQKARELYELLLRPADALLAQSKRIIILPDGPLYVLPFPALLRKDQYLIEWKPISTTLSATLFAQLKKQRKPPEAYQVSLAAFGDAIYKPEAKAAPQQAPRDRHLRSGGGDLGPLKYSKPEVESIAHLFPNSSRLYEGAEATEEHAKNLSTNIRFIHFSVHGLFNEDQPLDSSLAFSSPVEPQPSKDNGLLQAWELYQGPHWDADLVVLSACDSGLGKELAGEGLIGLTRAVHYAGARSVISSLWKVDDQRSEELMVELYKNLSKGASKDEALRAAQLSLLRTRAGAAPYNWAAFSLQGDWK
jgi:CHAT domain-containing protein